MKLLSAALLIAGSWIVAGAALASASPVSIEIIDANGQVFASSL